VESQALHLAVKSPAISAVLVALWLVGTVAFCVSFWARTETIKQSRLSGHRYWLINPRAIFAGYRKTNWTLYFWSLLIGLLSVAASFLIFFVAAEPN
jgi:ABC-type spermidine/putrescine transport system permease subunit I